MPTAARPDDPLVSTQWLADHFEAPDLRIVDASWHLPGSGRDPQAEYRAAHIPGAVFFDIDEICDLDSPLPHMAPSAEKFASRVQKLGLGDGLRIVVYDSTAIFSAARVWWLFRLMGHEDVRVLDGGLPKWQAEGRPTEDMPPMPGARHFTVRRHPAMIRDLDQVRAKLETGSAQLVDARPAARFEGTAPEPRAGLPSGHMPGARSVPWSTLMQPDGTMQEPDRIAEVFRAAGVDLSRRIVTTCGSGVSACVLTLGLARLGLWDVPVYDGSWAEWASQPGAPIATGPAA
jgi:thiosulfate/3-mercaptopyruvate sulfurtransferase